MLRKVKIHGVKWIDGNGLNNEEIKEVLSEYNFHELDVEACLEENQNARIDGYKDYLFIILHFPKYNYKTKIYELNEFNIFLGKDFIITLQDFGGFHLDQVFEKYKVAKDTKDKEIKLSTGFILYEMIQVMLEKMFNVDLFLKKDLKQIERQVFDGASSSLIKEIMIINRNLIFLKHMFKPQVSVLKKIEMHTNALFTGLIEEYYEDLEDKLDRIVSNLDILNEHINSVEAAFKTIIDIKTNSIIKILTIFSAFILPLTLITSFYGMNIVLPFQDQPNFVFIMTLFSMTAMSVVFIYFKKNGKI